MTSISSSFSTSVSENGDRSILTTVFAIDRLVCAVSVLTLTIGGFLIARVLEWPSWVVVAIGLGLVPYALILNHIHRTGTHHSWLAKQTAVGDAAWVVASIAVIVGWPDATSTAGKWIIAAIALVIAEIGFTKVYGWLRN